MADVANTTTAFCTNYEPCSDSPLSMSASVAGLITLTIAISATLKFYVSSYRDGIQGMDQLLRSLSISLDECTDALSASEAYLNSTFAEHEHDQARKRAQAIRTAAKKAADQVDSLHELTARLLSSPQQKWLGRYRRGVFVALQSEVNKRKSDNDAAMDVLRLTINKCVAPPLPHPFSTFSLHSPSTFVSGDEWRFEVSLLSFILPDTSSTKTSCIGNGKMVYFQE